ncbi:hypothetical protein [Roseiterribacter gracilis]
MFRKSMLALTLVMAGTGCAVADTSSADKMTMTAPAASAVRTEYPSQPGPYTVIYREWSDLAG